MKTNTKTTKNANTMTVAEATKALEIATKALEAAKKAEAKAAKKAKGTANGVKFEIVQHICTLSEGSWNTELNVVKWGDAAPKYDIRAWNEDHTRMDRGITLNKSEICALVKGFIAFANENK